MNISDPNYFKSSDWGKAAANVQKHNQVMESI